MPCFEALTYYSMSKDFYKGNLFKLMDYKNWKVLSLRTIVIYIFIMSKYVVKKFVKWEAKNSTMNNNS